MLTKSQEQAIKDIEAFINDSAVNVWCLSGSPGTGKSYTVKNEIMKLLDKSSYIPMLTATTNKAASIIDGITLCKAYGITLQANLKTGAQEYNTKYATTLKNHFVIIDEASMLERDLWDLVQQLSKNCKFLLVGDKYQLPPVQSKFDPFATYPVSELTEVVRQSDSGFLKEINNSKEGVINNTLYIPQENNCIHYLHSIGDVYKLLKTFTNDDKALAYTNDRSIKLANGIRQLQNKPSEFQVGDPVSPKNYCESIGSDKYKVFTGQDLTIATIGDEEVLQLGNYDITFKMMTFNEARGTYAVPTDYKYVQLVIKALAKAKDWVHYFQAKEKLVDLRFNEASTIHCAQGSTYDRVFIHLDDLLTCKAHSVKSRLLYVALSRAKHDVYIYSENIANE